MCNPQLGSHSQPECDREHLHVCLSFSARSCLFQVVVKAGTGTFHPRFTYSNRSLSFLLLASTTISASRTVRSMNKNFILSIASGFCVEYGPFEASPRFPFYFQKIILRWGSQFSCVSSVVSTVKQPLSWVAFLWVLSV